MKSISPKKTYKNGQQCIQSLGKQKSKLRCHLTHIRMAIIKQKNKMENDKYWQEYGEPGSLICDCWESKMVLLQWKMVSQFLKKLNTELPYGLAIPFLSIYIRELKTAVKQKLLDEHSSSFTIAKRWKHSKMSIHFCFISGQIVVYAYNRILLGHKKE